MFTMKDRSAIEQLFKKEKLGVLSVSGKTYPVNFLMAFAVSSDLKRLYFATSADEGKYGLILKRPAVSFLVDNRKNRESDFKRAAALTVLGRCLELRGAGRGAALKSLLKRHPALKKFFCRAETALFVLKISKFILVNSFQP
jgi:nitroimidazol reductase NimA-like FMN-containing flavoprotein (pyridoxamine 5'-phosphate oxidase superfamily)